MNTPRLFLTLMSPLTLAVLISGCDALQDTGDTAPQPFESLEGSLSKTSGGGEVWVTAQDASQIKIVHGLGRVETVPLPEGSGPHEVTFSPSGHYAYIANVGNGTLIVMRTHDREIVAILEIGSEGGGDVGTHQAVASPDGSTVLVAHIPSKTLFKLVADEAAESWDIVGSLALPESPICIAFRSDGGRAYVSLGPRGIALVDPVNLTHLGTLPTAGSAQCGLVPSKRDNLIYVDSRGEGAWEEGHFYLLDTDTDELTLWSQFPALDLHGFGVSANEKQAFIAERNGDALKVLDLTRPGAQPTTIVLDPRPEADMPDKVAVRGNTAYVTIRTSGQLAVVKGKGQVDYLDLVAPSPNALHGVAIRP